MKILDFTNEISKDTVITNLNSYIGTINKALEIRNRPEAYSILKDIRSALKNEITTYKNIKEHVNNSNLFNNYIDSLDSSFRKSSSYNSISMDNLKKNLRAVRFELDYCKNTIKLEGFCCCLFLSFVLCNIFYFNFFCHVW